jgi:hypothetical protein
MPGPQTVDYQLESVRTIIAYNRRLYRLLPTEETLDKVCHCVDISQWTGVREGLAGAGGLEKDLGSVGIDLILQGLARMWRGTDWELPQSFNAGLLSSRCMLEQAKMHGWSGLGHV